MCKYNVCDPCVVLCIGLSNSSVVNGSHQPIHARTLAHTHTHTHTHKLSHYSHSSGAHHSKLSRTATLARPCKRITTKTVEPAHTPLFNKT
uniref:Uncharacterized protein n=1 Tax=Rhipicephalus zambeziensis TaxID=60191 RepID=A0A224YLH6_9ACAR